MVSTQQAGFAYAVLCQNQPCRHAHGHFAVLAFHTAPTFVGLHLPNSARSPRRLVEVEARAAAVGVGEEKTSVGMSSTTSMGSGACAATAAVSTAAVSAMMAAPVRTGRARERYRKIMPGMFEEEGGVCDVCEKRSDQHLGTSCAQVAAFALLETGDLQTREQRWTSPPFHRMIMARPL